MVSSKPCKKYLRYVPSLHSDERWEYLSGSFRNLFQAIVLIVQKVKEQKSYSENGLYLSGLEKRKAHDCQLVRKKDFDV